MSSMWPADLFAIYHQAIHRGGLCFAPAEPGRIPSLLLQIELQPRARAGLDVVMISISSTCQWPFTFFRLFGIKFLQQLVFRIVSLGLDNAAAFLVNPRHHARIAIRGGMRIRAFQNDCRRGCCGIPSSKFSAPASGRNSRPKSATQKSDPANGVMAVSLPVKSAGSSLPEPA